MAPYDRSVPSPAARPARPWAVRLLAGLLVAQLGAGLVSVATLHRPASRPSPTPQAARAPASAQVRASAQGSPARSALDRADGARERSVRDLLTARADGLRRHDKAAFLAGVDPRSSAFLARQGRLFDALSPVPFGSWEYGLDAAAEQPHNADLDKRRGPSWWSPDVTLRYSLAGYDRTPTLETQHLTFVPRGGRWYLTADDDFDSVGQDTTRGLWDGGPVVVVRGRRSLVLGHPAAGGLLRTVADAVDAAVPRVTAVWGQDWARKVVVMVPDSQAELGRLLGSHSSLSQIAAVATAELDDKRSGYHPVGNRVIVNPPNFRRLGPLGRQVVLTHEVTHVASRAATGPSTPTWLAEGLADYVGYRSVDVPLSVSARELRSAVRNGKGPKALPSDEDFDANAGQLGETYQQSWLAVSRLAERYGQAKLLRFYREVGRSEGTEQEAVSNGLRSTYGLTEKAFVADWVRTLSTRLR